MSWWIMNLKQVGFDCLSDLNMNVKDGYKCNDGYWIWYSLDVEKDGYECYDRLSILYRLVFIVYLIWILMLRMDTNVVMDYEFKIGWNVEKDGYECYDGLSIWYRLGLIVYLIWILMSRIQVYWIPALVQF